MVLALYNCPYLMGPGLYSTRALVVTNEEIVADLAQTCSKSTAGRLNLGLRTSPCEVYPRIHERCIGRFTTPRALARKEAR